jgi:hypothetical protein
MGAYLDCVQGNGQFDVLVVFWRLALCAAWLAAWAWRARRGVCVHTLLGSVRKLVEMTRPLQAVSTGVGRPVPYKDRARTSCPLRASSCRGTVGPWPWLFLASRHWHATIRPARKRAIVSASVHCSGAGCSFCVHRRRRACCCGRHGGAGAR